MHEIDPTKEDISNNEAAKYLQQIVMLDDYYNRAGELQANDIDFLKRTLPELLGILPIATQPVDSFGLPFKRLVINKTITGGVHKRLTSLKDLRYPPREIAHNIGWNRASLKGETVFYAGMHILTLAVETQPRKGDLYTISTWEHIPGHTLHLLVICQDAEVAMNNPLELLEDYNQYNRFMHDIKPNLRKVIEAVYRFIVKAFTREVDPNNRQEYLFSALLAHHFFNHPIHQVDAIYFPSVPNEGAVMNIAVLPDIIDEKFRMIEASEYICMQNPNPDAPGWMSYSTGTCKTYKADTLQLEWKNEHIPEHYPVNELIEKHQIDLG
jgi:hypothetical protein